MDDITSLQIRVISDQVDRAVKRLDQLEGVASRVDKNVSHMSSGVQGAMQKLSDFTNVVRGAIGVLTRLWQIAQVPIQVTRQFQILRAQLETATGSVEGMETAWKALMKFAAQTPFGLQDSVSAFTKLVNYGLTPSERALRSYGDTAAATGKQMDMLIEAVADAVNNEFERTKEAFNVKAKNMGDTIEFRFRGATTTVKNSAAEIEKYFIELGENNFAGSMEKQMLTLQGAFAGIEDEWQSLLYNLTTSTGAADLFGESLRGVAGFLGELNTVINSGELAAFWESQRHQIVPLVNDVLKLKSELGFLFSEMSHYLGMSETDWKLLATNLPLFFRVGVKAAELELQAFYLETAKTMELMKAPFDVAAAHLETVFTKAIETVKALMSTLTNAWNIALSKAQPVIDSTKSVAKIGYETYIKPHVDEIVGSVSATTQALADEVSQKVASGVSSVVAKAAAAGLPTKVDGMGEQIQNALFPKTLQGEIDRIGAKYKETKKAIQEAEAALLMDTLEGIATTQSFLDEAQKRRAEWDAAQAAQGGDQLAQFYQGATGEESAASAAKKKTGRGGGGGKISEFDKLVQELSAEEAAIRDSYERRLEIIQNNTAAGSAAQTELSLSLLAQYEEDRLAFHRSRQSEYDSLVEWLAAERDIIKESYEERRQIILAATELTENQKLEALAKAQKKYAQQMAASFQQTSDEYLGAAASMFGDLASMGETFGKTGFKIAQGAAIAEATINMYSSAVAAYKTGASLPGGAFLGPVFAAAALAAGAANIAKIKSQTYSGAYEHGGMIPAGKVGLVGEAGPEFIRGPMAVTSARTTADFGGKASAQKETVININNYSGQPVEQSRTEDDHRIIIDLVVGRAVEKVAGDIARGGGPVSRSMERTYGLGRGKRVG